MMSFKYFVEEYVRKGIMVQMLQDEIVKSNHLLFNELLKRGKHAHAMGDKRSHATLRC
jgi:hypothetical protein